MATLAQAANAAVKLRLDPEFEAMALGQSIDEPKPSIVRRVSIFRARIAQADDQINP